MTNLSKKKVVVKKEKRRKKVSSTNFFLNRVRQAIKKGVDVTTTHAYLFANPKEKLAIKNIIKEHESKANEY